jgi:uncharacterized RDD family membrane protein YckC
MSGIFLSYRRDDSAGWAGRLYEHLVREWGAAHVFIDIDAIAPGEDFREAIARTMHTCDVVMVIIGPNWVSARDRVGNRRLDDEGDTHRTEVVAALAADVRVIPVLVGGADMPPASQLPEPLRDLCYRNAAIIEDRRFASDARALMDALKQFAENLASQRSAEEEAKRAEQQEAVRRAEEEAKRAEQQEAARRAVRNAEWHAKERHPSPLSPSPAAGVGCPDELQVAERHLVSRGNRFGAALIDAMILALLLVPALIYALISPQEPCEDDAAKECVTDVTAGIATGLSVLGLAGWGAYKIVQDGGTNGQTLGKRAVGVRVVDLRTGGSIGYSKAAGRTLLVVALLSCCWILLIVELFRRDPRQLLHDKVVGSVVIKT